MSAAGHHFHRVASISEIPEGDALHVKLEQWEIAVFNVGGEFYAIDDVCTHAFASLSEGFVEGDVIECPLHGGRFEIKTGKAVAAPCTDDVRTYPVRREDDSVLVGIPAAD
ncbi:MAG TPA: bifunctional 3-phenylpropionate/cinnamic acid dioxygenase ferredoxin subunit [Xanthobacteraceae bacterium]